MGVCCYFRSCSVINYDFFRWLIMIRDEFLYIFRKVGNKSKKAWTDSFSNGFSTDSLLYVDLNKKSAWSVKTISDEHKFLYISPLFWICVHWVCLDQYQWSHEHTFPLKIIFSCIDTLSFASMKEIGEKLIIFDLLMYIDRRARNNKLKLLGISRNLWFSWKFSKPIKLNSQ